jgi:hypothetical protein
MDFMMRTRVSVLVVLSTLVLLSGSSLAGVEDILGKWIVKAETPNGPLELEFELKLEGTKLVGSVGAFQGSVPLSGIRFEDPNLTAEAVIAGATFRLTGALKDGKFTGEWQQIKIESKGTWSAERKPVAMTASSGVAGEWESVAVTPNGELKMKLDLKQVGEKLEGTLASEMGSINLKDASFKDNNLKFDIEVQATTFRVEAALKDGRFTGKWTQVGTGDTGAWSASRKAPAAPAASSTAPAAMLLDGAWNSVAVLPDGTNFPLAVTFKQEGDTVTGHVVGPDGNIAVRNGKYAGGKLAFEIEVMGSMYRVEAENVSGKLTGKWVAVKGTDSGAWSAERKPSTATPPKNP